MENKTLTFYIDTSGNIPNSIDNQNNNSNATKNDNAVKGLMDELPLKKLAIAATAKKSLTMAAQRVGMYTGNQVLQRQINNSMSLASGVTQLAVAFAVNPVIGVGVLASQAISYGFELSDYNLNLNRTNETTRNEQLNYNTSLNNNRYSGGTR